MKKIITNIEKYRKIRNKTRNITRNKRRNKTRIKRRNKTRNKTRYLEKKYNKILIGGTPYENTKDSAIERITNIVGENNIENVKKYLNKVIGDSMFSPINQTRILTVFEEFIKQEQNADTNEKQYKQILLPAITKILDDTMETALKKVTLTPIFALFGFDYQNPIDDKTKEVILKSYEDTELIKSILIDIFILLCNESNWSHYNSLIDKMTLTLRSSSTSTLSASSTSTLPSSSTSISGSSTLDNTSSSEQNPLAQAIAACLRFNKTTTDNLRICISQTLPNTTQEDIDRQLQQDRDAQSLRAWQRSGSGSKYTFPTELLGGGKHKKSHKTRVSISKFYKKLVTKNNNVHKKTKHNNKNHY